MKPPISQGPCLGCGVDLKKSHIKRHIKSCKHLHNLVANGTLEQFHQRMENIIPDYIPVGPIPHTPTHQPIMRPSDKVPAFLMHVFAGSYWMMLLVPKEMKLHVLDRFLRLTWLECCYHLSYFKIDDQQYFCPSEFRGNNPNDGVKVMSDYRIKDVMNETTTVVHTYDMGTSTELGLQIIGEWVTPTTEEVIVLSRNRSIQWPCEQCMNGIATCYCTWCNDGICQTCSQQHDCEAIADLNSRRSADKQITQYEVMPIYNSPRSGACGYCGPSNIDYYGP